MSTGQVLSERPWRPAWFDREDVGEVVPVVVILGRTDTMVAAISGMVAYKQGFLFDLVTKIRNLDASLSAFPTQPGATQSTEGFRIELQFPDGTKVSSSEAMAHTTPASGVGLILLNGNGGAGRWDMRWLVSGVPGPGDIHFSTEWRQVGMSFQRSIDAAPIVEASERSALLWSPNID